MQAITVPKKGKPKASPNTQHTPSPSPDNGAGKGIAMDASAHNAYGVPNIAITQIYGVADAIQEYKARGDSGGLPILADHPDYENPRQDEYGVVSEETVHDVAENGVSQPIILARTEDGEYVILDGKTRMLGMVRRAVELGDTSLTVPYLLFTGTADAAKGLMLTTNFLRANLSDLAVGRVIYRMHREQGMSLNEVARVLGKTGPRGKALVRQMLAVAEDPTLSAGMEKGLPAAAARRLTKTTDEEVRANAVKEILGEVAAGNTSQTDLDRVTKKALRKAGVSIERKRTPMAFKDLQHKLAVIYLEVKSRLKNNWEFYSKPSNATVTMEDCLEAMEIVRMLGVVTGLAAAMGVVHDTGNISVDEAMEAIEEAIPVNVRSTWPEEVRDWRPE